MAATSKFTELLKLEDDDFRQLRFLAETAHVLLGRSREDEAAAIFHALTILSPGDPVGPLGLAEIHLRRHEFQAADRAAHQATRVKNLTPNTMALAYSVLARSATLRGDLTNAERWWREVEAIDRGGPWETAGHEMAEAIKAMRAEKETNDGRDR